MNSFLSSLSPSQREAVEYVDGPQLVIAGPGSGKTRVLTCKIAYLLSRGMKPWNILALTFTNKAAREMNERVASLVGSDKAHYLNMGTFHSIFLRILRVESEAIGLKSNFTIYDDSDSRALVGSIVKELQLDDKQYKPASVLSRIGMAKNNLITPDAYLADSSLLERDHYARMPRVGDIYRLYAQRCLIANAVDFDDMLLFTYMLFKNHPDICAKYADRFRYVLVDEYQDTNYAQQCIVTLLTRSQSRICVVGDDAQSIYAFRGANIDNILDFQNIYTGARLFKLEQNYRSTQNIVGAANCLIRHNRRQIDKSVYSENPEGGKVELNIAYSDKEEADTVATEILRLHRREATPYSSFAILYRTNAQSRLFEDELRRQGTPYRIYGGMSFYQRKEIKDVTAYLRLVANPDDEEALKRVINYPRRGIGATSVDRLIDAARRRGKSLWTVVADPTTFAEGIAPASARRIAGFHNMMQVYINQRNATDAYVLGKRIVEETGLIAEIYAGGDAEAQDRRDNVEEFFSAMRQFVDAKRDEGREDEATVDRFLQEVALATDADTQDSDTDSQEGRVSLMTVHASKGLEFNTVFVVGMEENLFPSPRSCDNVRQLEEERRLFYVAMTRAREHCFLSCAKSRYQYGNMMFNQPSRFLYEIDSKWLNVNGRLAPLRRSELDEVAQPQVNGRKGQYSTSHGQQFSSRERYSASRDMQSMTQMPDLTRYHRLGTRPVSLSSSVSSSALLSTSSSVPQDNGKQSLSVGARIEHQRFGKGCVVSVVGSGENEKATVNFDGVGEKTLLLKFARFTLIE